MKELYIKKINELLVDYEDDFIMESALLELKDRLLAVENSIAVVGQFSVGKSALLNALLGDEILSTRRIEATKVLTKIKTVHSKEEQKLRLYFKNGHSEDLPIEDIESLASYTTFQGTEVTEELSLVELYWPVSFLNEHLTLIDTPGANSLTAEAFKVTEEALEEAAAIIYLFNGQKGMDQTDYKLITELLEGQKTIFLVATHIDGLTNDEWSLVEQTIYANLKQINKADEIKLYPVSSLLALEGKKENDQKKLNESNIYLLENELQTFMETAAYESASLQSIKYDFEQLQKEIAIEQASLKEKEELEQIQRQERYERLIAITQLNFRKVEQAGLEILKKRLDEILNKSRKHNPQLTEINKKYKKIYKRAFNQFIEKAMTIINSPEILMEEFRIMENNFNDLYHDWLQEIKKQNDLTIQEIHSEAKSFDQHFISLMGQFESDVKVDWTTFQFELETIELPDVQLQFEYANLDSIINDYKAFQDETNKEKEKFAKSEKKIMRNSRKEQGRYEKELKKIAVDKQVLGSAPEVETKSSESGWWIFKKTHYYEDDSKLLEWKETLEKLEEKRRLIQAHMFETEEAFENKKEELAEEKERFLNKIANEEEDLLSELMDIVLSSINTNHSYADELTAEISNTITEQWNNQMKKYQVYEEVRIEETVQVFKSFIKKLEAEEINQIQVI